MGSRKNGRARGRQARREGASSLSPRVSLSRAPILSCADYFQAPATQATQLGGGKPVTSVVKDFELGTTEGKSSSVEIKAGLDFGTSELQVLRMRSNHSPTLPPVMEVVSVTRSYGKPRL